MTVDSVTSSGSIANSGEHVMANPNQNGGSFRPPVPSRSGPGDFNRVRSAIDGNRTIQELIADGVEGGKLSEDEGLEFLQRAADLASKQSLKMSDGRFTGAEAREMKREQVVLLKELNVCINDDLRTDPSELSENAELIIDTASNNYFAQDNILQGLDARSLSTHEVSMANVLQDLDDPLKYLHDHSLSTHEVSPAEGGNSYASQYQMKYSGGVIAPEMLADLLVDTKNYINSLRQT
jgi:hypothetical protein